MSALSLQIPQWLDLYRTSSWPFVTHTMMNYDILLLTINTIHKNHVPAVTTVLQSFSFDVHVVGNPRDRDIAGRATDSVVGLLCATTTVMSNTSTQAQSLDSGLVASRIPRVASTSSTTRLRTSKSQPQRQHQQRISSASPPNIDTSIRRTSTSPYEDQQAPYSTGVDDKDTELPSDLDSVIPVRSQFLETESRGSQP